MRIALVLAAYAFLSNVALAVVPHEPAILLAGPQLGVWVTTLVATAATVAAAWVDHRVFVPLIKRFGRSVPTLKSGPDEALRLRRSAVPGPGLSLGSDPRLIARLFNRAPFAILALSGLTPLPFFPFKALALSSGYALRPYLAAVTARCLPRYALLAWLGVAVRIPAWVLALAFILLSLPTVRLLWPPRSPRAS
jgi:ribonucleoside-triphosphate reductase